LYTQGVLNKNTFGEIEMSQQMVRNARGEMERMPEDLSTIVFIDRKGYIRLSTTVPSLAFRVVYGLSHEDFYISQYGSNIEAMKAAIKHYESCLDHFDEWGYLCSEDDYS
jgi:hypothetical protein